MYQVIVSEWYSDFDNNLITNHIKTQTICFEETALEIYNETVEHYTSKYNDSGVYVLVKKYENKTKLDAGDCGILIEFKELESKGSTYAESFQDPTDYV